MNVVTYRAIRGRVRSDPYGAEQVAQYADGYGFPASPDALLYEAAWVIVGAGVSHTAARGMQEAVNVALAENAPIRAACSHHRKAEAIEHVRDHRHELYDALRAAYDADDWQLMLAHLSHVPFLRGPALSRHMAKNLGADVAKPDIHLTRIARQSGETVDDLCARLSRETGDRVSVVDLTLFLAAGPLRLIRSHDRSTWPPHREVA